MYNLSLKKINIKKNCIKMGKTEVENLDLKSKLNIVSGIIANAKKDLESLKTEIIDVKSDSEMFKNNLNSLNNEFIEYLKESLKVSDSLIEIILLLKIILTHVQKQTCLIITNRVITRRVITRCVIMRRVIMKKNLAIN